MRNRLVWILILSTSAIGILALGSCTSITPADPDRQHLAAQTLSWPERRTAGLDAWVTKTPFVETRAREMTAFFSKSLSSGTIESTVGVWRAERVGAGVVREVEPGGCSYPTSDLSPMLQFVCPMPAEFCGDLGSRDDRASVDGPSEIVDFQVRQPSVPPRGIVVHLASFGAPEQEAHVIDALVERGWLVVSSDFPWCAYRPRTVELGASTDVSSVVRAFAQRMDARLAVWADAARAVVDYVERRRPDVSDNVVVLGFSAGAIGGPVVAAHLGEHVRAEVFIGGGANVFSIARRSDLDALELRLTGSDPVSDPKVLEGMDAAYLQESRLDPWNVAGVTARVPALLVDARFDHVVPRDAATHLWERLGRPERWTVLGGHTILFWRLPHLASDIADWIDRAVQG
jgi:dienelactone hydrolase